MAEQGEKVHAVSIIADDVLASIAPTCDMVDGPRVFKTERTMHEARGGPHV